MKHQIHYYDSGNHSDKAAFSNRLSGMLKEQLTPEQALVILCIGTDKVTGDSLGPFVGHQLQKNLQGYPQIFVYGTLEHPVHAINLEETLSQIERDLNCFYHDYVVLVVDASLGFANHLGYVTLSNRPIHPGEGVNKKLPQVGQISITGIIGEARSSSYKSQLTLRQARLFDLMQLADFISDGILSSLSISDFTSQASSVNC